MKTKDLLLITIGTIIFNLLFWNKGAGVNFTLFASLISFILLIINRNKIGQLALLSTIGTLVAGIAFIYYHSTISMVGLILSFVLNITFIKEPEIKSIGTALYHTLMSLGFFPSFLVKNTSIESPSKEVTSLFKRSKLILLPIIVLTVFITIFKYANPIFDDLTIYIGTEIGEFFKHFFDWISFGQICFSILGFIILGWIFFGEHVKSILSKEKRASDFIMRKKSIKTAANSQNKSFGLNALVTENKIALIMVGLINSLLLVINSIDIIYVWFNFTFSPEENLSSAVHEGTYLLILSILLSMGILLYYFRKNQNFYQKNNTLKVLSYVWIIQNIILVASVFLRNFHYIENYGLAYKRIGVLIFLCLTVFGLASLALKIRDRKSTYFLIRKNLIAVYTTLLIMTIINWDMIIVNHNINHPQQMNMDYTFLLDLSPKTYPVLLKNKSKLERKVIGRRDITYSRLLDEKIENYVNHQQNKHWLSWNYSDQQTLLKLNKNYAQKLADNH